MGHQHQRHQQCPTRFIKLKFPVHAEEDANRKNKKARQIPPYPRCVVQPRADAHGAAYESGLLVGCRVRVDDGVSSIRSDWSSLVNLSHRYIECESSRDVSKPKAARASARLLQNAGSEALPCRAWCEIEAASHTSTSSWLMHYSYDVLTFSTFAPYRISDLWCILKGVRVSCRVGITNNEKEVNVRNSVA